MPEPARTRTYTSTRRTQQAAATRRVILQAAQLLFERDGYVPTTMEAVATEAGVALKTVYKAFGTKAGLLRAVWDLLLKGDLDDAPVAARPWYQQALAETDHRRMLELVVRNSCLVKRRIGAILAVIRSAAVVDPDAAALWDLIQTDFWHNQRAIVGALHAHGGLRADLDPDQAADILWALNHPNTWLLLVHERAWNADQFEAWFLDTVQHQLLNAPLDPHSHP
ncbi:MAG TPA: helix-turn-helix domain-containing protein [Kineosporiaceae bacterium]|nr:helix-turn-helix domain-containing protein [Kineosporiaceae bacterium]